MLLSSLHVASLQQLNLITIKQTLYESNKINCINAGCSIID